MGGSAKLEQDELRDLSLSGTTVTDEQLAGLSGLKKLRRLDLSATEIGDLGIRRLAALA